MGYAVTCVYMLRTLTTLRASPVAVCHAALTCMQKDSTLSKLAAMEGAVPKQLQPTFKKVIQKLQQVAVTWQPNSACPLSPLSSLQ